MTPLQQFCLLMLIPVGYQAYLQVFQPERYEREATFRNNNIKGVANATASVVRFLMKR